MLNKIFRFKLGMYDMPWYAPMMLRNMQSKVREHKVYMEWLKDVAKYPPLNRKPDYVNSNGSKFWFINM